MPGTSGAWHQTFKRLWLAADDWRMFRSVIGLCAMVGLFVGGYLPALWGGSSFGLASLFCGALGGVAGVWAGYRLTS